MAVVNRQKENREKALPARITENELGKAMSQLDLSSVPPHKRGLAIRAHLLSIMGTTITDRALGRDIIAQRLSAMSQYARTKGLL